LRLTRRREDSTRISLEHFQPGLNVLSVIRPRFRAQSQVPASERGAQLGYQLFSRIGVIAEALA
jgi:hypothetical protein